MKNKDQIDKYMNTYRYQNKYKTYILILSCATAAKTEFAIIQI